MIVEDQRTAAGAMRTRLQGLGYRVAGIIDSGEAALDQIGKLMPDLVLMDIRLGAGMDGIEAARRIHETHDIPVVFISAYADEATVARARSASPAGFINKPFTTRDLLTTLQLALYRNPGQVEAETSAVRGPLPENQPGEGIITADLDGKISFVNRDAERYTGWKRRELLGRPLHEVLEALYRIPQRDAQQMVRTSLKGGPSAQRVRLGEIAGHDGDVLRPMRDASGSPFGVSLRFTRTVSSDSFPAADALAMSLKHACDTLPQGMLIVDGNLRLQFANQHARSLIRDGRWLRVQEEHVVLPDTQQHQTLLKLVTSALESTDAPQIRGLRLNGGAAGQPFDLAIVQLGNRGATANGAPPTHVAIHVFTAPTSDVDPVVMRDLFQLTAKEVRLALELLSDKSVDQIAQILGISPNTLRTHQKHIFHKAGVSTREDLRWRVRTGPAGLRERLSLLLH